MSYRFKQTATGDFLITDQMNNDSVTGTSSVSTVVAKHVAIGPLVVTTLTLNNVAQTVVNGTEYQGTKIFGFPECRLNVLGVIATLQQKTTSAIASTLNSGVTGAISLGTVTASNVSLTGTMVDLLPSTAFVTSTVINVAGTAVSAVLAASAVFDGHTTAKDMYLNTAYATTADVDADATQTISGTVVITWLNLGDY